MNLLAVALGGALGSVLRYVMVQMIMGPWAVMIVNVLGSFVMGLAFVFLAGRDQLSLLVMTGMLGGFTTFSAFSLDAFKLWEAGRMAEAGLYVLGSVLISLVAVTLGAALARSLA